MALCLLCIRCSLCKTNTAKCFCNSSVRTSTPTVTSCFCNAFSASGKSCGDMPDSNAGAVLDCLRQHRPQLSSECRKEELKLNILQSQDVRLQPTLHKQCSEEIAVFCQEVEPGWGPLSASTCPQALSPEGHPIIWSGIVLYLDHK